MFCIKYHIPATNNNALIGRPWIAEVSQAVRHQGGKVVDLVIVTDSLSIYLELKKIYASESNPPREVPEEEDVQGEVEEAVKIKHN